MIFNINDYTSKCCVMHCANIFEAMNFTQHLHSLGKRWSNGNKYSDIHHWNDYKEETAYNFNHNTYGRVTDYERDGYTVLEWKDFMYNMPATFVDKTNVYDRNIISLCGHDFIKFPEENGIIPVVMQGYMWEERFSNNTNNFDGSLIFDSMQGLLNAIEMEIGADNVIEFETDLTTLNGHKDYGTVKSKISLPTFDFYRRHIEIFDKYQDDIGEYWWLSTPFNINRNRCCAVSYNGDVLSSGCDNYHKMRPILYIKADALTAQN